MKYLEIDTIEQTAEHIGKILSLGFGTRQFDFWGFEQRDQNLSCKDIETHIEHGWGYIEIVDSTDRSLRIEALDGSDRFSYVSAQTGFEVDEGESAWIALQQRRCSRYWELHPIALEPKGYWKEVGQRGEISFNFVGIRTQGVAGGWDALSRIVVWENGRVTIPSSPSSGLTIEQCKILQKALVEAIEVREKLYQSTENLYQSGKTSLAEPLEKPLRMKDQFGEYWEIQIEGNKQPIRIRLSQNQYRLAGEDTERTCWRIGVPFVSTTSLLCVRLIGMALEDAIAVDLDTFPGNA
jgi:hypothetical protein